MNQPKVSIIMSVYRESVADIQVSIESLLEQTYSNWELVVVLDDPENHNAEHYLHSLTTKYPNIKLLKNEKNMGLGGALNRAVAVATGEYCARMDTEDIALPERLEKQVSYLLENPRTDVLFTRWREIYEDGTTRDRLPQTKFFQNLNKYFFTKSLILHPTMMIKAEILREHPYPEMARPEDLPLFMKLIRLDYKFAVLKEVLYEYKVDRREKYGKVRAYSRNFLPILVKNIPYYWHNIYFWFYFKRLVAEYLISRNRFIYEHTNVVLTKIWRFIFKQ